MTDKLNVFQKILRTHGLVPEGSELHIIPDQVLTQDATATPVFLQLEAMQVNQVKPFVVSYIDHNTLQTDHKNADDHLYLERMAKKLGATLSRAGNGICHQVNLERFSIPGNILLGSDSHTSTAGGAGMIGIGAGGLDIAAAIAGRPYVLPRPRVVGLLLSGKLPHGCSAKDIVLWILKKIKVKGGIGKVFEFFGEGVSTLSVHERATICNMGAETGATTSLFPSDANTLRFLEAFGRPECWKEVKADPGCAYDEVMEINLSELEPLVACPHSPDNVNTVRSLRDLELTQIAIGSCTNSSFKDMAVAAHILKGRQVAEGVSLVVSPGSRQILAKMCETGIIKDFVDAGARILEPTCGPCNGIGQAPESGSNSLRTHNRNFKGRSGTADANVYLCSVETAAVSALTGKLTDPRTVDFSISFPDETFQRNDGLLSIPDAPDSTVEVVRGPNIKPIPTAHPLENELELPVVLKLGDNISTDDILPGGLKMLSLRSNVPDSIPYVFSRVRPDFHASIPELPQKWLLIGGENFGQGSSREHAVMVPLAAGLRVVIAKSFARIYRKNLINFGILPFVFENADDYQSLDENDLVQLDDVHRSIENRKISARIQGKNKTIDLSCDFSPAEIEIIFAGGLLNLIKAEHESNDS